jgi:DNA end-binding protein Ku
MAALTESVSKAKASRGEDADVHDMPKKTAKKQPVKKAAAKKTARKSKSA